MQNPKVKPRKAGMGENSVEKKRNKQTLNRAVQAARHQLGKSSASNPFITGGSGTRQPKHRKQVGRANQKEEDKPNTGRKQEDSKGQGPFFYVGGTSGTSLITAFCRDKGWKQILDNNRDDYYFKWSDAKVVSNYQNFQEGKQMVNQIPNKSVLTSKFGLCSSLKNNERIMNKYGRITFSRFMKLDEFYPETYRMVIKSERHAFYQAFQEGQIWISKPAESSQGKGIFLLKTLDDLKAFHEKLESTKENPYIRMCFYNSPINRIVQRYIDEPLLLEGRKFDVRSYFLIACSSPFVTFFRHGYAKLTCNEYNPNSDDLTDHLTNQFIQKKNPRYSDMKEDTVWSMEHLNDYINEKYMQAKQLPKDWVFTDFTNRIQQIVTQCFIASKARLGSKLGYFDLFGCDIMIDQNFKTNCAVLQSVVPKVLNEALDLVLEIFKKRSSGLSIMPLEALKEFVLLYNGSPKEPFMKTFKDQTAERAVVLERPQQSENSSQIKVGTTFDLMSATEPASVQRRQLPRVNTLLHPGTLPEISLVQHLCSASTGNDSNLQSSNHSAIVSSDERGLQNHAPDLGLSKRQKMYPCLRLALTKQHSASQHLHKSLQDNLFTSHASFHSLIITRNHLAPRKLHPNQLRQRLTPKQSVHALN
ncbi:protein polyglycylase TTLL10-like isoform X3 [Hemitrygon akajei]|uniref:protein polyglycylase TTLL10-like isoform X3 n=1 Tax=Hemitrygon akajei TaxID=2704970 RepID=UPI003BFA05C4